MKTNLSMAFFLLLFISCTEHDIVQKYHIEDFNTTVFDTLKNEKGIVLSKLMDSNKTLLYIANNECSECISNFIDFNDLLQDSGISDEYNVIYIIYGYDKLSFDYYMKREKVRIDDNIHIANDTLDFFHDKINNYYSNALFFIDENMNVYSIQSSIPEYEWDINDIIRLTK